MDSVYAFLLYETTGSDKVTLVKTLFNERTTNFYERSRMKGYKVDRATLEGVEPGKLVVFSRTYVKTYVVHVIKTVETSGRQTVAVCIADRTVDGVEAKLTRLARDGTVTLETLFRTEAIQKDLEECVETMTEVVSKVLERGEKIEELEKKTQQLTEESEKFRKQPEKLNRCCVLL